MANPRRGEISAMIGGEPRTLCLTLGALAELEAAFAAEDLQALGRRFGEGRLATRDLLALLAAGLSGGGSALTAQDLAAMPLGGNLPDLVDAAARLLQAAFGGPEVPGDAPFAEAMPARDPPPGPGA
jgi:hypothetical protein